MKEKYKEFANVMLKDYLRFFLPAPGRLSANQVKDICNVPCRHDKEQPYNRFSCLPAPLVRGLANNHILDQGKKGLISTLSVLKKSGISIAGAGRNLEEAGKPLIFCLGKTIGV